MTESFVGKVKRLFGELSQLVFIKVVIFVLVLADSQKIAGGGGTRAIEASRIFRNSFVSPPESLTGAGTPIGIAVGAGGLLRRKLKVNTPTSDSSPSANNDRTPIVTLPLGS